MRPSFSPSTYRRLVLKVGSGILTGASGPRPEVLQALASQLAQLQQEGREVLVVSSGAVATGVAHLGLNKPRTLPEKQAAAAFGQPLLMEAWNQALQAYHLSAAQVLLTAEDIADRGRYLSLRETLETLLRWKVIPILNENDPVVAEEIKFGDNDQLSALIAILVEADLLLLLSEAGALYTQDPRTHPEASPLDEVERVTPELYRLG
jgi:glutamate 5-kinase